MNQYRKSIFALVFLTGLLASQLIFESVNPTTQNLVLGSTTTDPELAKWDQFVTDLQKPDNKILTIEQAIKALAASTSFISQYTMLYDSRSLQDASFEFPRVITYGADAKLMLAFNGDPSQAGYGSLEFMRFNDVNKTFELREIVFPEDKTRSPASNSTVRVSKTNPSRCIVCHGLNPRPNWDTYPFWPGVYGSEDDVLFDNTGYSERDETSLELKKYREFVRGNRRKGRYQWLPGEDFKFIRPNTILTGYLLKLNFQKVAAELARNKRFSNFKKAILTMFPERWPQSENDISFSDFPSPLREKLQDHFHDEVLKTRELQRFSLERKIARQKRLVGSFMSHRFLAGDFAKTPAQLSGPMEDFTGSSGVEYLKAYQAYPLTAMRTLAAQLGVPSKNWSQEYLPRAYGFQDSNYGFFELRKPLLEAFDSKSKASATLKYPVIDTKALAGAIQKCLSCHQDGKNGAPIIPYGDSAKFSSLINREDGTYLRSIMKRLHLPLADPHHMPPQEVLPNEERVAFQLYLESLIEKNRDR